MASLPSEIVHLILQAFREDIRTLMKCSLVNLSWLHEAQRLLFSTHPICIDFVDKAQNHTWITWVRQRGPDEFVQLMNESPHLSPLIRMVKLNLVSSPEDNRELYYPQRSMEDLLSPLRKAGLQRLEALVLCDIDSTYEKNVDVILSQMEMVDPTLEVSFSFVTRLDLDGLIKAPNLISLQCLLCSLPQLRHLSLRTMPLFQNLPSNQNPVRPPNTLRLQRLEIGNYDDRRDGGAFIEWLPQTYTVETLEHLTFLNLWDIHHLAGFVRTLSKPWSLRMEDGDWCESGLLLSYTHLLIRTPRVLLQVDRPDFIRYPD
jgi:hypothetical protein